MKEGSQRSPRHVLVGGLIFAAIVLCMIPVAMLLDARKFEREVNELPKMPLAELLDKKHGGFEYERQGDLIAIRYWTAFRTQFKEYHVLLGDVHSDEAITLMKKKAMELTEQDN